jgi:hypothetical protein
MAMREEGAVIQLGETSADVALTRNNQSVLIAREFERNPRLAWILWVDWDISAPVESVVLLIAVAEALASHEGYYPSVSGSYVNRHYKSRAELAGFALNDCKTVVVSLPDAANEGKLLELRCVTALTGMGCFLQRWDTFNAHRVESETFRYLPKVQSPCMCQQHVMHASELAQWVDVNPNEDERYWIAEDFDFCIRELDHGRLVYLAPIVFGHDKLVRCEPDSRTVFPGLVGPEKLDLIG